MHIQNLQLATSDLAVQSEFYTCVFQFPMLHTTAEQVVFQVGSSQLTFRMQSAVVAGAYHFAFNIPEQQFAAATEWLLQHVPLIADAKGTTSFYSDDWNAHNVYFYDPAGNIVELIARHTLSSANDRPFSGQSILNISEIGIATDDVLAEADRIVKRSGSAVYHGPASDTFTAVGDEHGLFIIVKRGRIWFPDTGKAAESLPLAVETQVPAGCLSWQFS